MSLSIPSLSIIIAIGAPVVTPSNKPETIVTLSDSSLSDLKEVFPEFVKHRLPDTEAGVTPIDGRITFKVNDHYFRSVAKIAFHYYLIYSHRGYRGNETYFDPIRDFIMNGGDHEPFFNQTGPKFAMPFGDLPSGGVIEKVRKDFIAYYYL